MKRPLLTGLMAATAMMMIAAPTDGSPIIVFDDDRRECARPAMVWIDPWSPFAFDLELLDECDDSESNPAIAAARRGPGGIGGGMGAAALAGAFLTRGPRIAALPPSSLPAPQIGVDPSWPTTNTFPLREPPSIDGFEWPGSDQSGLSSLAPAFTPDSDAQMLVAFQDLNIKDPGVTNPAVVPEPRSLFLLGTGLALAARRLRKRT